MPSKILILSTLIVASLRDVSAFLSQNNHFVGLRAPATTRSTKYQELHLFEEASDFASSVTANNLLLATIDSDIANIPDNEFATVFAGGIVSFLCLYVLLSVRVSLTLTLFAFYLFNLQLL